MHERGNFKACVTVITDSKKGSGDWKFDKKELVLNIVTMEQVFLDHSSSLGMELFDLFLFSYSTSFRFLLLSPPHNSNVTD